MPTNNTTVIEVSSPKSVAIDVSNPKSVAIDVNHGAVGPQGPRGTQGMGADTTYYFVQGVPSDTWVIDHNLGRHPSVTVVDSGGTQVYGEVLYNSNNRLTLIFSNQFSGQAYLN